MTHEQLIAQIAANTSMDDTQVAEMLSDLTHLLAVRLMEGDDIKLPKVGILSIVKENERVIVDPDNPDERYLVPPRIVPVILSNDKLSKQVNESR